MKIIFLDIDGVLNHKNSPLCGAVFGIDYTLLPLLKNILDQTGAKIVLSSSWRLSIHPRLRVKDALASIGAEFIDCTKYLGGPRANEIQEWLNRHPEVTDFIILDDDIDAEIVGHFFQTSMNYGLTEKHVKGIIRYFNRVI